MSEDKTHPNRLEQIKQAAQTATQTFVSEGAAASAGAEQWLKFSFNGLATPPVRAVRSLLHVFSWLEVHPGTWAVCHTPDQAPLILKPGVHWLTGLRGTTTMVQFVDARRQRLALPPVTSLSRDGWNITLEVTLAYEVTDPVQVARAHEPIADLEAAAKAAILAQIETMPHESLLGTVDSVKKEPVGAMTGQDGSLEMVAQGVLKRLKARPGLSGLEILDVVVVSREGDRRLLNIVQEEALNRIEAHQIHQTEVARSGLGKMRLEMEVQTAEAEREVSLIKAETESRLAEIQQQTRLIEARAEAEMQEIRQTQEAREAERKRLAEEWRTAKELDLKSMEYQHAETLAIIEGTTQITTEAAKIGMLHIPGSAGRVDVGGHPDGQAVTNGIQALRGFREKIAPPTTHFLPTPSQLGRPATPPEAGGYGGRGTRLEMEELRLERIPHASYEVSVKRGEVTGATIRFTLEASPRLRNLQLMMACSEDYPVTPPVVMVTHHGTQAGYTPSDWSPALFLADIAREFMLDWINQPETVVEVTAQKRANHHEGQPDPALVD